MAGTKQAKSRANWGTVRKQRSGLYQASYTGPDGERHKAPHTFSAKNDARAWLSKQHAAISNGSWKSPAQLEAEARALAAATFGPYAEAWITQRTNSKGEPLAPRTQLDYRRYLVTGLAQFAGTPLHEITPAVVRKWHSERLKKGATQAGQEARFMHAVFATALADELITRNPVDPKLGRSKTGLKRDAISSDDLATVLATVGERFYIAVVLAAFGGLRNSEWRALRRKDIILTQAPDGTALSAAVNVERQAQYLTGQGWEVGPPKSDEGVRIVELPDWAAPEIAGHLRERTGEFPDSLLFAPTGSSEFVHDSQFRKAWKVAKAAAGFGDDISPHSLRHHAGTQYGLQGATLAELKEFLGHSTSAAAMVYQHSTNRASELANKLAKPTIKKPNVTKLPVKTAVN